MVDDDYLSSDQAADIIGVADHTMRGWATQKRISAVRGISGWRYKRSDVEAFAATYERPKNAHDKLRRSRPTPRYVLLRMLVDWCPRPVTSVTLTGFARQTGGHVRRQLLELADEGLAQRTGDTWSATEAGRRLVATYPLFQVEEVAEAS